MSLQEALLDADDVEDVDIPQPDGFLCCTTPGCNRKYKTPERLDKHIAGCKDKDSSSKSRRHKKQKDSPQSNVALPVNDDEDEDEEAGPAANSKKEKRGLSKYYFCVVVGCEKKYRASEKLIMHVQKDHQQVLNEADVPVPEFPTKDNKIRVKKEKLADKLEKERVVLLEKKRQEEIAQKEAEKEALIQFKEQQKQRILELENKKLTTAEKQAEIEENIVEQADKANIATDCTICINLINKRVSCVPCGHATFCSDCLHNWLATNRACPVCNRYVSTTVNLFM